MRRIGSTLLLACLCGVAAAQEPGMQGPGIGMQQGPPRDSLERAMVHKALAQSLVQRSGRKPAEIAALLEQSSPPEVGQQLGIDPQAMHLMVLSARRGAVQRALGAGLIDGSDAQRIERAIDQEARGGSMMGQGNEGPGGMPRQGGSGPRAPAGGW